MARPCGVEAGSRLAEAGKDGLAATASFGVAVGVAAAWIPFRAGHSNVDVALALVVVMTAAGVTRRRAAVLGAVVGAALAFTFFDTQPFDRLSMARDPDIFTAVSLVVVGLITGELALRVARQRRSDGSATSELSRVREAASALALGEELVVMIGGVADKLILVLDLRDCWFSAEAPEAGSLVVGRDGNLTESPPAEAGAPAAKAWPGGDVALPVWGLGQIVGHFLLRPRRPLGRPQLLVAVTLADQVGAALAAQAPVVPLAAADAPAPNLRVVH